ncbi:MAG: PLP-dependent aminotransferase family protein [Amphritea sp.]
MNTSSDLFIPLLESAIQAPQASHQPLYRGLFNAIQQAIVKGQLQPGDKLPASRALSVSLNVSRNTVKQVYEMLLAEGYIETRHGAGSFVSAQFALQEASGQQHNVSGEAIRLSDKSRQLNKIRPFYDHSPKQLLLPALPALDRFPWQQWQRSVACAGRAMKFASGSETLGAPSLRKEIAAYLKITRGIQCSAEQVLICSGSQQGMHLSFSMLLNPGDQVLVEDPGFPGIDGAISSAGGVKVPVPVDQQGFCVSQAFSRAPAAKLAFLTPSRNFPMGHTLSLERRLALLQWAQNSGSCIIEDDYDSEFRFDGPPLTALQGLGGEHSVIYSGTFSRVLHPSIRLGYLVLPPAVVEPFAQMRSFLDGGLSALPQLALADFMAKGHFASHLRRMRKLYQQRRDILLHKVTRMFDDQLRWIESDGGMHAVFLLPEGADDRWIAQQALTRNLGIRPLSYYYDKEQPQSGLVIGFSGYDEESITKGLQILQPLVEKAISEIYS